MITERQSTMMMMMMIDETDGGDKRTFFNWSESSDYFVIGE